METPNAVAPVSSLADLHQHTFRAMGSEIVIWLAHADAHLAGQLLQQAQAMFDQAEARMTRFAASSELSQLNRQAGSWVNVSRPLWQVLEQAWQLAAETGGLFDPTLLTAIEAAGYRQSFSGAWAWGAQDQPQPRAGQKGAWQQVQRQPASHAIYLPAGVQLDLGGIGKGFTAEQVVNFLNVWGGCLVDAGGDLVAGDAPFDWPGWPVTIVKPWPISEGDSETVVEIWLNNGALATSGIDYRWWLQAGQRQHHIIDPHTGAPANTDLLTASVVSATAGRAEAWAKAALIVGQRAASQLLEERQLAALLIDQFQQVAPTTTLQKFIKVASVCGSDVLIGEAHN